MLRQGSALQLAVNQFSVHDHRNRFGLVNVIATKFKNVLVQDNQVGLLATAIADEPVDGRNLFALVERPDCRESLADLLYGMRRFRLK